MPRRNGVDWESVYSAIFRWFSQGADIQCMWAKQQHAPELAKPYGIISRPSSVIQVGDDYVLREHDAATDENIHTLVGVREMTVQFDILSADNVPPRDAMSIAEAAHSHMINDQTGIADACLALITPGALIDNSALEGAHWVSRATFDMRLRLPLVIESARRVGIIKNAQATIIGRDGVDGLPVQESINTEG